MYTVFDHAGDNLYQERFGLAFEQLVPGLRIAHRPGVTLSQQDNVHEALQTCNGAMLHYDEAYAAQTSWQRPLMVSTLSLQRLLGLTWRSFGRRRRIVRMARIAMTRPVFGGDTLYAQTEVLAVSPLHAAPDLRWGEVQLRTCGLNQRGETVADLEYTVELWSAGQAPGELPDAVPALEARFASHRQRDDGAWVEQSGMYFEDLREGEVYIHAPRRSLHAHEALSQALAAQEWAGPHHDLQVAALLEPAAPQMPQTWVLGVAVALSTRTFGRVCANLGWTDVVFGVPVRAGDTLESRSRIVGLRDSASRPGEGVVRVHTSARNQHGTEVVAFERTLLVYRRGSAAPYEAAGY